MHQLYNFAHENALDLLQLLPNIQDIQRQLTTTRSSTATTPDQIPPDFLKIFSNELSPLLLPLVHKVYITGQEPLQLKQSLLIWLHKPNASHSQVQGYRNIILASHIPKRIHAFLRKQLIAHTEHTFLKTVLGGLPHKSTDFATLMVTTFLQTGKQTKTPQALLFVDLTAAFYTIIRELCIRTSTSPNALQESLKKKQFTHDQIQQILNNLQTQQYSPPDELPQTLNMLLAEYYHETSYTSPVTQDTFHTTLGTRAPCHLPTFSSTTPLTRHYKR
jgi:hypothetical protein